MENTAKTYYNNFYAGELKSVSIAFANQYVTETLHPDRTMYEHDVFYVVEGEWEVSQEGISYPLKKDDVIILFGGLHHYGLKPCSKNTQTIFIHFGKNKKDEFSCEQNKSEKYVSLPVVVNCAKNPLIKRYFNEMATLFFENDEHKQIRLSSQLLLLFCELSSLKKETNDQLISNIITLFGKKINKFFSAEELADTFYVSKRSIYSIFKQSTGVSPHEYQLNAKLDICKKIIQAGEPINFRELAEKYGFYDEFHFSKAFKKRFGVSPKQLKPKVK